MKKEDSKSITYKIEFFTYWHTGSGLSSGTEANATVIKNKQGLPYIPGKTIKGLLREAAEAIQKFSHNTLVTEDFILEVFGRGDQDKKEEEAATTTRCFFSNAELSNQLTIALSEQAQQKWLYETLSSTAINEKGLAEKNALRTMEVTVPLTLFGKIEQVPIGYEEQLLLCMKWTKRLGVNRNRGLGRCQWTLRNQE